MKTVIHYIIERVKPLLIIFIAISFLLRLVFSIWEKKNVLSDIAYLPWSFVTGVIFDLAAFSYFLIPIMLFFLCVPAGNKNHRPSRRAEAIFLFMLIYVLIFTAVAEIIFWEEFAARFNFIAVDYLVYTQEVIGNIWQSYPIVWLLSGIAAISLLLTKWILKKTIKNVSPPVGIRFGGFSLAIICAVISFFAIPGTLANNGDNRYIQEIGKDGYFELFSAFRNNDLSYNRFYAKMDPAIALEEARRVVAGGAVTFTDKNLTHHVTASGREKHKNIMLITVESLSGDYFKVFGNKKKLTTHLDKLVDESLFFTNLYATGTRTVYGLSAVNLSIPPIPGNSIVRRPENGGLFSLAAVLNRKGYDSRFIYGGYGYFDNMNAFFEGNGYKIVDRSNLSKKEITFENIWGVCDEDLFTRSMVEADASYKAGKPFFNMMMTTSNHRPYTYPEGKIDIPSGKGGRSGGVKYTDYAIHQFIESARTKPWFNDTIFVIVADHTASSSGKTALDSDKYHIPLIIYAPGMIKPQKIDTLASQIDVAPTLLGLMNMNYESRFYGADLMKKKPQRAFISNYQKLGYMTPNELAILEPVEKMSVFKRDVSGLTKETSGNKEIENTTTAIYQTAARWKELNQDIVKK